MASKTHRANENRVKFKPECPLSTKNSKPETNQNITNTRNKQINEQSNPFLSTNQKTDQAQNSLKEFFSTNNNHTKTQSQPWPQSKTQSQNRQS
jgi:hypothetical protein